MKDLLAKLEAAETGSRELDEEIHRLVSEPPKVPRGEACPHCGTSWYHHVPSYTTSLDASLPGENIVSTSKRIDGEWWATHWTGTTGVLGKAHTEALARRIAALKAMLAATGDA